MRKREESCWVDPRFRKRKDMPKAIKLGKLGQAPPPIERPTYATAKAVPSGMTCPPCPPGTRRSTASYRPTSSYSRQATAPRAQPVSTSLRAPTNPAAMAPAGLKAAVQTRQFVASSPLAPRQSAMYRPGTALPQRPMTAQPPVLVTASPCPPQPCPPQPCPPDPCPEPCPQMGPSRARPSGLPRMSGLRPPTAGGSRLRPPSMMPATSITARRSRSPVPQEPCPQEQYPPDPCAQDPCPPCMPDPCPPCMPDPCAGASGFSGGSQMHTPGSRRPLRSALRPPSRLMGPGFSGRAQKPQKIVILPGDINPGETTVITVEPPQQPAPCSPPRMQSRSGAGRPSEHWIPPPLVPMDFSPPSMESCQRNFMPTAPYIPPEIQSFLDTLPTPCQPDPSEMGTPTMETSRGLLIDVTPIDPRTFEPPQVLVEPVDLMTFPPPDPFSPEWHLKPISPSVTPPPIPFSPPKSPLPEPSDLHKWYSQYPQYKQAFTSASHPILEYSRFRRDRPPTPPSPPRVLGGQHRTPACVDKEVKARTVPFNQKLATICPDDSDEEDLGLLPECIGEEYLTTPLDYEAIRQREEQERQELLARQKEEERRMYGPTLAETREMLERVRETESARRSALRPLSPSRPPPIPMEVSRERYRRLISKAERVGALEGRAEIMSAIPECYSMLQDVAMDDMDLDAIDMSDECPDF